MASKLIASTLRRTSLGKFPIRHLSTAAAAAALSPPSAAEPYDEPSGISMKGVKISGRPLYLDMQATSPVDPRVLDTMLPYNISRFGNPHSRTHLYCWELDNAVEAARAQIAALINASPKEIVFTSSAIESNNISVFSFSLFLLHSFSISRPPSLYLISSPFTETLSPFHKTLATTTLPSSLCQPKTRHHHEPNLSLTPVFSGEAQVAVFAHALMHLER